jgi:crossover junction endodeoxyribonuclease RuvC
MDSRPTRKGSPKEPAPKPGFRRIIGVDPGLASTGWGIVDSGASRVRYVAHGCIETGAELPHGDRLFFIHQEFCRVLKQYDPGESAIEKLYFGRNVTSALAVAEVRGILILALVSRGLPVLELTPNAIKQGVVGLASADKAQIQEMVRIILGLEEIPAPNHAADALGAAICRAHSPLILP